LIFSPSFIAEVRAASDILAIVGQYVELKRAGGGSYKGLCPFHSERSPSFTVNGQDQFFYCFGCNTGGDVIKFLQLISGMSFPEVVAELAGKAGIKLPDVPRGDIREEREARERKNRLHEAMQRATEYFSDLLWDSVGTGTRNYLRERGVDDDTSQSFRLGYSPDGWDGLLRTMTAEGYDEGLLLEAGLVKAREGQGRGCYDTFRGRLMVPVADADGRTVAFGGRILKPGPVEVPKYVNSPVTPIYKKGTVLFGLPQARPYLKAFGCAYVVEGYFDLIALVSAGIKNVVAALGTAFTQAQVNLLRGKAKTVYLLFDGDNAGREAAKKSLPKLLNAEIDGRVVELPGDHDPDTYVREFGPEGILHLVEKAPDVLDYAVSRLVASHPATLIGQAQALREVRDLIAEVPDNAKGQLLRRMFCERLGVDPGLIRLSPDHGQGPAPAVAPGHKSGSQDKSHDNVAGRLLRHVITYPETAHMLGELTLYWPEDQSLVLFKEIVGQFGEAGRVDPTGLMLYEHDELLNLVSEAALTTRSLSGEEAMVVFREYSGRLRQIGVNTALTRLAAYIREAESRGDSEKVEALLKEQRELTREKRALDTSASPTMH
jgi:DNA primase